MKIAVIFPGIGYTKDRPLLYFAGKIARERGFDLKFAKYPDISWSKEKLKDHGFLEEAVKKCLSSFHFKEHRNRHCDGICKHELS